jgi:hypothetical protein
MTGIEERILEESKRISSIERWSLIMAGLAAGLAIGAGGTYVVYEMGWNNDIYNLLHTKIQSESKKPVETMKYTP